MPATTPALPVLPSVHRAATSAVVNALREYEDLVRRARGEVRTEADLGDRAGAALAAGGNLYFGGDPGFVAEAVGRAGGLMMSQGLGAPGTGTPGSVLVYGWLTPAQVTRDTAWLQQVKAKGILTLGIGPTSPPSPDLFNGSLATGADALLRGRPDCGLRTTGNAIALWTLTGEIISGLTRRGKTPSIWQSIWVKGSSERNALRSGHAFDPVLTVAPLPPRRLALEYTDFLLHALHTVYGEAPLLEGAAEDLAEAKAAGRHARVYVIAHMVGSEIEASEREAGLDPLQDPVHPDSVQAGDAVLVLGYVGIPEDLARAVQAAPAAGAWFVAPTPDLKAPTAPHNILIDAGWRPGDVSVTIPGYDVGALPPSGVLQMAAYCAVTSALSVVENGLPARHLHDGTGE